MLFTNEMYQLAPYLGFKYAGGSVANKSTNGRSTMTISSCPAVPSTGAQKSTNKTGLNLFTIANASPAWPLGFPRFLFDPAALCPTSVSAASDSDHGGGDSSSADGDGAATSNRANQFADQTYIFRLQPPGTPPPPPGIGGNTMPSIGSCKCSSLSGSAG